MQGPLEELSIGGWGEAAPRVDLLTGVLDESGDSVMITDIDGNIVWVNQAFVGVTGYTPSETVGKTPRILKSGLNSSSMYEGLWKTIKAGRKWRGTVYNKKKNGHLYLEKQKIIPIRSQKGELETFVSIRKELDEILEPGNTVGTRVAPPDTVPEGIIGANSDLLITIWNKGAERIYGWRAEEILGKKLTDVFLNELSIAQLKNRIATLEKTGELRELVYARTKDGHGILVERTVTSRWGPDNRQLGFIGIHRAVLGGVRPRHAADGAQGFLSSIFDSISEGILLTDPSRKIIMCNQVASTALAVPAESIQGKTVSELPNLPGQISGTWDDLLSDVLAGGGVRKSEVSVRIDGRVKSFGSTCFAVEDSAGKRTIAGLVFEDTSLVRPSPEVSGDVDELAEIGKMAAHLSHEIKTPLNSIRMNLDFLEGVLDLSPSKKRSFDIMRKEVARLSAVVNEVLQLAKPGAGQIGPTRVSEIINDVGLLFKTLMLEKGIEFRNEVEGTVIHANADRLKSAFANLVENAIDAIGENGVISFWSETDRQRGSFVVHVSDDGSGVSVPDMIFRPFFSTKKGGTGLGLVVVRDILKKFGGDIELESGTPGKTVFKISFSI